MNIFQNSQGIEEPSFVYWRPKAQCLRYPAYVDAVMAGQQHPINYPINPVHPVTHAHGNIQDMNSKMITNSLIHDEVIRAAKMLFSKRNRTLMHWLNPGVSKNQLKIDVNTAWDNLQLPEKVFYILQVLGKFAPQSSSLMVNPHLEAKTNSRTNGKKVKCNNIISVQDKEINIEHNLKVKTENFDDDKNWEKQHTSKINSDSRMETENNYETHVISNTQNLFQEMLSVPKTEDIKKKNSSNIKTSKEQAKKRHLEYNDEASQDSGLVDDIETVEKPKVKRKYTKRQNKKPEAESSITEIKTELTSCAIPVNAKNIKGQPKPDTTAPRVKRKYVKHKLVRKKYKKREPKKKPIEGAISESNITCAQVEQKQFQELTCEDMDLWIELTDDLPSERFVLLDEEVDKILETIGDPNTLFDEL